MTEGATYDFFAEDKVKSGVLGDSFLLIPKSGSSMFLGELEAL